MTKALIAFIALLGLFISNKVFADTCHASSSWLVSTQFTYYASNCPVEYFGSMSYRTGDTRNSRTQFIGSDGSEIWIYVIRGTATGPALCDVRPDSPSCPPRVNCPDGSSAPGGDLNQCSIETKTQKICSATPGGGTVCIDVEANNLIDAVTSFCASIGSSAAATDSANNVGSCANGTGVFTLGFNSAPIANAPPNATSCSSSACVTDAVNGITRETLPDGSTSVTQVTSDGTTISTITSPNGTEKVTTSTPDGTVSIVISNPNGSSSTSITTPDGTNTTNSNNVDGSTSVTITSPNGDTNATTTTASGTTTNTTVINGVKTISINAPPPAPPPALPPPPPPPTSTGANSTDLTPVVSRLDYLVNASRTAASQTEQQLSQAFYANQRLAELVSSTGATLTALSDVKNAVGSTTSAVNAVGEKVDGLGTSIDGLGEKIDQTNSKLDGIGDTLQGISDGLTGSEFSLPTVSDSDITDSLGLSNSGGIDSLYSPDVELTSVYSTFSGWLPNSQTCPTLPPVTLPWVGEFSWDFTIFCDLLSIFGVLVMAAAYVSVPFIIFGGKK